jgi:MFS family permease
MNQQLKSRADSAGPMLAASFTVFLDLVGFGMILPMLPYYAESFGASAFTIGLLFSSYSLAQFVCSPLWGRLSDRRGRRRPLLASILLSGFAYLLLAAAPNLTIVFVARILAGAAAANYTIAQAFVADVTSEKDRAKAMGWIGAAFGFGFVVGPALGGGLSHLGVQAVPLGAALLATANFALVWRAIPATSSHRPRDHREEPAQGLWKAVSKAGQLPAILLLYGTVIVAFSAMEATLALFCEDRLGFGIRKTALLFVFVGLLMIVVQAGLIGRLVARWGETRLAIIGLTMMTAGMILLAAVKTVAPLLLAMAWVAIGSACFNPSIFSLISRLAPAQSQGSVLGLARSLGALARVVGPVGGGWAFHQLGPSSPFLGAGLILALAMASALWLSFRHPLPAEPAAVLGESL